MFSQNAGAWTGLKGPPGRKDPSEFLGEHIAGT